MTAERLQIQNGQHGQQQKVRMIAKSWGASAQRKGGAQ